MLNRTRIDRLHHHDRLHLRYGDLTEGGSLSHLVRDTGPEEIYNLAAMSHVGVSFEMPECTAPTNAAGLRSGFIARTPATRSLRSTHAAPTATLNHESPRRARAS